MAPQIVALMPAHDRYVEPFSGGASVLLRKSRSQTEVYNDLDSEVVNVFRCLRDEPDRLIAHIELTPYSREEWEDAYEPTTDPIESARRFIYRCASTIGTDGAWRPAGFRTSLSDDQNSTSKSWALLPFHLKAVVRRLQGVLIENRDAIAVMTAYDAPHVLHYVDPPYMAKTRRGVRMIKHTASHTA